MSLEEGLVLGGKYRLVRPLSGGGMGVVWLAEHVDLGIEVALKLLAKNEGSGWQRVRREARAIARLQCPHIVRIHDYGESASWCFIVMERLRGCDLAEVLRRENRLALGFVVALGEQLGEALNATHGSQLIHRDLKPSNIFLTSYRKEVVAKLLDFGIVKSLQATQATQYTAEGTIVGTIRYMSPEQASGEPLDHRSDLWSLAAVLFEALSGEPLIEARHPGAVVQQLARPEYVWNRIAALLPGDELRQFFRKSMAKQPAERFASAESMLAALRRVAQPQTLPLTWLHHREPERDQGEAAGAPLDPPGEGRDAPTEELNS